MQRVDLFHLGSIGFLSRTLGFERGCPRGRNFHLVQGSTVFNPVCEPEGHVCDEGRIFYSGQQIIIRAQYSHEKHASDTYEEYRSPKVDHSETPSTFT